MGSSLKKSSNSLSEVPEVEKNLNQKKNHSVSKRKKGRREPLRRGS